MYRLLGIYFVILAIGLVALTYLPEQARPSEKTRCGCSEECACKEPCPCVSMASARPCCSGCRCGSK